MPSTTSYRPTRGFANLKYVVALVSGLLESASWWIVLGALVAVYVLQIGGFADFSGWASPLKYAGGFGTFFLTFYLGFAYSKFLAHQATANGIVSAVSDASWAFWGACPDTPEHAHFTAVCVRWGQSAMRAATRLGPDPEGDDPAGSARQERTAAWAAVRGLEEGHQVYHHATVLSLRDLDAKLGDLESLCQSRLPLPLYALAFVVIHLLVAVTIFEISPGDVHWVQLVQKVTTLAILLTVWGVSVAFADPWGDDATDLSLDEYLAQLGQIRRDARRAAARAPTDGGPSEDPVQPAGPTPSPVGREPLWGAGGHSWTRERLYAPGEDDYYR